MTRQGLATNLGGNVQCWSVQFTYADLQALVGAGAKNINLFNILSGPPYNTSQAFTFPQASIILKIRVKASVAFAGGTLSAMTLSVGKGGAVTQFTAAYDIFQAVGDTVLQETATPAMGQLSAITPTVTFTPTGDTCANCTAGVVNIDIFYLPVTTVGEFANGVQVTPNPL